MAGRDVVFHQVHGRNLIVELGLIPDEQDPDDDEWVRLQALIERDDRAHLVIAKARARALLPQNQPEPGHEQLTADQLDWLYGRGRAQRREYTRRLKARRRRKRNR